MEEQILTRWFEALNKHDWTSIESLYTSDALVHGKDGLLRGGASVVELIKKWLKAMPDSHITPLHTSTEADVIVVHWRTEGTLVGSIREFKPTGKKTVVHGLTCFRCKEGKVIEHWAAVDYLPLQPQSKQGV